MFRSITLIAGLSLLAGCISLPAPGPEPGPGATPVTARAATDMFKNICVGTAPNFSEAPRRLAALPFQLNRRSGIYYHRDLNLSFMIFTQDGHRICSIVFDPEGDPGRAARMLETSGGSYLVNARPFSAPGDSKTYVNAKLIFAPGG